MELRILPKLAWAGSKPSEDLKDLNTPASIVFFSYIFKNYSLPRSKASPGPRPTLRECYRELVYLLNGDRNRGLPDIKYNFMIGAERTVFEGRGWFKQPELLRRHYKMRDRSLYVTFVGDYSEAQPSKEMFETRQDFVKYAVEKNYLTKRFYEVTI